MCKAPNLSIRLHEEEDNVLYCQHCLSLKIITIPDTVSSYCGFCGNTDLLEVHILEWEEFFFEDTGTSFIPGKEDEIQGRINERVLKEIDKQTTESDE